MDNAITSDANTGLPDELRQLVLLKHQKRQEVIASLGKVVAEKRDEAFRGRKESGIERIWKEDREYYLGIDDSNRAKHPFTKGMDANAGLQSQTRTQGSGATAFFNITRQFVDSASARMGDILLPAGDWNFSISATEVPELDEIKGSKQPVEDISGNQATTPDGQPYTLGQFAKDEAYEADKKAKAAETRIRDWLTECAYHSEVRRVIENSAQVGTGVLRGPYPENKKTRSVKNGVLTVRRETKPISKSVDPEKCYPDPSCGSNIQNGSYFIEEDALSARQLRELKSDDRYIAENIDKILKEGPDKSNLGLDGSYLAEVGTKSDDRFRAWYFYGDINLDELEALTGDKGEESRDAVPAVVVLINDTVIRGFMNPTDNGEFPYDFMPWQQINDSPWGIGVARQGRVAQDLMNAGGRALANNMGVSYAPQIVFKQNAVIPYDGEMALVGGKLWMATEESGVRSVDDAFKTYTIPSNQPELERIMLTASKMFEDATGVTFLLQGQQGSAPDTVGGMQLLHRNASALLRRIARVFDERITEPHIRRYYDYLLIHGEDEEKGDLHIRAIGSTSLVEREIQAEQTVQLLNMALNPAFEMSPKKARDELLRSMRFEPSKFLMDENEKQELAQMQPPPAPQVQAAQIRAETDKEIAGKRIEAELMMDKNDVDRDAIYAQTQANREVVTAQSKREELLLRRELAMLQYANDQKITLDNVKKEMAQTVLKIKATKELAAMSASADKLPKPPVEPPGQARPGRSFTE